MKKLKALFISAISTLIRKKYIVATSTRGLIAYDKKDYDKVLVSLGYETPIEIMQFKSWTKAINYCREHGDEYPPLYEEDDYFDFYEEEL